MVKRFLLALILLGGVPIAAQSQTGVDKPRYEIVTYRGSTLLGSFEIELFPLIAPLHVQNFDSLVNENFFDSTAFHRVVPGFVIQGGDPNTINGPISTWGQGQPWQPTVPAEFSAVRHLRGILGAARDTNINSANSQFYVCVAPATFLDGNYTVYGKVTTGMSVVDTIVLSPRDVNDVPLQKISMFINYIGVNDTVPDPVVLTDPANQAVNIGASQVFRWSTVPGAVLYTIEYATDSLFNNIVLTKKAGTNQTIANTLPLITGVCGPTTEDTKASTRRCGASLCSLGLSPW
jgi:peptidyl-prolyl cis-trans isomerase B (cyclophilin B)